MESLRNEPCRERGCIKVGQQRKATMASQTHASWQSGETQLGRATILQSKEGAAFISTGRSRSQPHLYSEGHGYLHLANTEASPVQNNLSCQTKLCTELHHSSVRY